MPNGKGHEQLALNKGNFKGFCVVYPLYMVTNRAKVVTLTYLKIDHLSKTTRSTHAIMKTQDHRSKQVQS